MFYAALHVSTGYSCYRKSWPDRLSRRNKKIKKNFTSSTRLLLFPSLVRTTSHIGPGPPHLTVPAHPASSVPCFNTNTSQGERVIPRKLCPSKMRGRRFSEDLRWAVIRAQYHELDPIAVSALTGVSECQVRRIHNCFKQTGDVRTAHDQWGEETWGRNAALTIEHRQVWNIISLFHARVKC